MPPTSLLSRVPATVSLICIMLFATLAVFVPSAHAQADDTAQAEYTAKHVIVIRDDGFYILAPDSPSLVKIASGKIVDQRGGNGGGGGDIDPPDGGDLSERGEQIRVFSTALDDDKTVTALSVVFKSLHNSGISGQASAEQAFNTAFTMVLGTQHGGGGIPAEWETWKAQVLALAGGWDVDFFKDISDGLAASIDAQEVVAASLAEVNRFVPEASSEEALDLNQIIALITQILTLLRDLGILGT